jgi:hypothetical protein
MALSMASSIPSPVRINKSSRHDPLNGRAARWWTRIGYPATEERQDHGRSIGHVRSNPERWQQHYGRFYESTLKPGVAEHELVPDPTDRVAIYTGEETDN